MLFDGVDNLLRNVAKLQGHSDNKSDVMKLRFHDYHDPEINRLYSSSPPAPDEMVSYNFDREHKKKVNDE